ncbi:MAG: hypothetical protein A2Z88_05575 [Omnitrophica WOR_2 bacterium GWA2_47_8]|nr:MAG: hypothetical protein A2Z88_05575 [Omnitrophica WOR_2 bacterium GWA2_47_8]
MKGLFLIMLIYIFQLPVVNGWAEVKVPTVFVTQDECEQKTGMQCSYVMCDYIPEGKTFEEVCGKGFQEGWGPTSVKLDLLNKDNAYECGKKGGYLTEEGDIPGRCNLPTTDKGKICSDDSECEGDCIAALTGNQFEDIKDGKLVVKTQGICSDHVFVLGCHPHVENGEIKGIECRD